MADNTSIQMGKELLEIAVEFENIVQRLGTIGNTLENEKKRMEEAAYYSGENRENLTLANKAASGHVGNLSDFYGMCYAYTTYAFKSMIELDQALAQEIVKAYAGESNGK